MGSPAGVVEPKRLVVLLVLGVVAPDPEADDCAKRFDPPPNPEFDAALGLNIDDGAAAVLDDPPALAPEVEFMPNMPPEEGGLVEAGAPNRLPGCDVAVEPEELPPNSVFPPAEPPKSVLPEDDVEGALFPNNPPPLACP